MTTPKLTWHETSSGNWPAHEPFLTQDVEGNYDDWNDPSDPNWEFISHWAYFNPPVSAIDKAVNDELKRNSHLHEASFRAGYKAGMATINRFSKEN